MKRSLTNPEKAIIICKLQASANKLKGPVLEKVVAIRELNKLNVRLRSDLNLSQRVSNVWMITTCVMTIMDAVNDECTLYEIEVYPLHGFS